MCHHSPRVGVEGTAAVALLLVLHIHALQVLRRAPLLLLLLLGVDAVLLKR